MDIIHSQQKMLTDTGDQQQESCFVPLQLLLTAGVPCIKLPPCLQEEPREPQPCALLLPFPLTTANASEAHGVSFKQSLTEPKELWGYIRTLFYHSSNCLLCSIHTFNCHLSKILDSAFVLGESQWRESECACALWSRELLGRRGKLLMAKQLRFHWRSWSFAVLPASI